MKTGEGLLMAEIVMMVEGDLRSSREFGGDAHLHRTGTSSYRAVSPYLYTGTRASYEYHTASMIRKK